MDKGKWGGSLTLKGIGEKGIGEDEKKSSSISPSLYFSLTFISSLCFNACTMASSADRASMPSS